MDRGRPSISRISKSTWYIWDRVSFVITSSTVPNLAIFPSLNAQI